MKVCRHSVFSCFNACGANAAVQAVVADVMAATVAVSGKLERVLARQHGLMFPIFPTSFREPAHFAATIIAAQGEDPTPQQLQHLECTERMPRKQLANAPPLCDEKWVCEYYPALQA